MLQSSQRRRPLVTEDPIYFSIAVIGIPIHDVKTEILFVFEVMIKRTFRYTGSGLSADKAARKILRGVVKKKARIMASSGTYFVDWLQRLFPSGYRVVMMPLLVSSETAVSQ